MAKTKHAPAAAAAPGTQKIVFLRTHPGYGYWVGNVAELADEHAVLLTEGGFARPATAADEISTPATATDETR